MFAFSDQRGAIEIAFTDRFGGASTGPCATLNLSPHSDDSPEAVRRNLATVTEALSGDPATPSVSMHQVHGCDVVAVDTDLPGDSTAEPNADALLTGEPGRVLLARAADCVPVLLADPGTGLIAATHAGRAGVALGVVTRTVEALRARGAARLTAWVGPRVCGRCYEVPDRLRAEVAAVVPQTWAETSWGTSALDLGAGVVAQLHAATDGDVEVVDVDRCTVEDESLYSYRRQGPASGRHAGLIWRRP